MKKKILIMAALVQVSTLTAFGQATITKEDRTAAIEHLKQTQNELLKTIKGLTEEQLNYKPSEDSWSVAECVEHLAISESSIFALVAKSMNEEANPSRRSELKFDDEGIVKMISDRSYKVKTSKPFEPSGKFGDFKGSLSEFKNQRKNNIKYVKTTDEDLRNHFFEFPFGLADTYQVIRFMSGHTTRHTKQIKEIIASDGYPAS